MRRTTRIAVGLMAVAMTASGCFGSFNLTRKLYRWNDGISKDRWAKEFVFLVLSWAQAYSLAGLGDAIVLNSIEFWTGKNPIEMSSAGATQTKRVASRDAEARLTHRLSSFGEQLVIEQFRQGQAAGRVSIQRLGEMSVATDQNGAVLFTAQTLPDGSLVICDGHGRQVAAHSAEEIDRLAAAWGTSSSATKN